MSFLTPWAFLLGLLLPVIVAFYLLKLRRIEHAVPSTYLWRRMVRDVEANAPWQKLKPSLLMILQLLFLAALILALARPFRLVAGFGGQAAIFVLDTSASMSAQDVAPSRIESARQRANQIVDELPTNTRITIIEAGRDARVLLSSSLDRRQAHQAVADVRPGTSGSDMTVALELASAIAARQPGTQIIVFSDGRVDLPARLALKGALRYLPFGLHGENQAISLLTLKHAPGGAVAFAQVKNYGAKPASRRMSLFADGSLVNVYDLNDLPPGGQKNIIADGLPAGTQRIEAQLNGADALALDDHAFAILPAVQNLPVTLVTPGNLFIRTALGLLPGVALTEQTTPDTADPQALPTPDTLTLPPSSPAAGTNSTILTIYDATVPDVLADSGSLLFIGPTRSTQFFTITGEAFTPSPRAIDPADPLLEGISLTQVNVRSAARIGLPDWAVPVIAGDLPGENIPLLFRGEVNGRRIAVLSFNLHDSDLPLQIAFPVLWANLLNWLAPNSQAGLPALVVPGEALTFRAPAGVTQVQVTRPDGTTERLQPDQGQLTIADTRALGEYTLHFTPAAGLPAVPDAAFAVNLFSPQESDLKPADSLAGVESQAAAGSAGDQQAVHEWWRPLALLALGLLVGEWLVYQRGALARLRDMLLRQPVWQKRKP